MRSSRPLRRPTALLLIGLVGLVTLTSIAPAQQPERKMRIFDCGSLTQYLRDQPGPDLRRFAFAAEAAETFDEIDVPSFIDPDRLVDLIKGNIRPDSWEHKKNTIHFRNGLLIVVQTPDVLDDVAELLRGLRHRVRDHMHLVGRVLSVRLDHLGAGHGTAARRGGAVLESEEVRQLLDVPPGDDRVRELGTFSIPARSGQLVHAASVRGTRFVCDLETAVGVGVAAVEPVLDRMLTGIVLAFRAFPVGRSMVVLNAHVTRAEAQGEMDSIETGIGPVDIPVRSLQASSTTLLVTRHGAAMLAVNDAADPKRAIVFLVEPRIVTPGTQPAKEQDAGDTAKATRTIRIYDVRFLTTAYPDRPCRYVSIDSPGREMGLSEPEEEGGNTFGSPAEDAGIPYNPEDLIELIKDSIDEDSWANTRNAIDLSGGFLLVVQKPEVHAEIRKLIDRLTARRGVLITTQAWALAVADDAVRGLFPDPIALGRPLDVKTLAAVHRAVADGRAEVLGHGRLTGFNRQRSHIVSVIERPVIAEVNPKLGDKGSMIMDPGMRALRTGFVLDVTPNLVGDTENLSLDLFIRRRTVSDLRLVPFSDVKSLVVHRWNAESADLHTSVYLPDGGAMAFLRGAAPGRPGHTMVFLVTARATALTGRD